MASLPTHLSSTCDSVKNNSLLNYHVEGPFVRVGNTNRDKRILLSGLVPPTGIKGLGPFVPGGATNRDKRGTFCPGWYLQPGQKAPVPPAGPASLWTRDKSHKLSRAQRQPGQMAWNKCLFCSSETFHAVDNLTLDGNGKMAKVH